MTVFILPYYPKSVFFPYKMCHTKLLSPVTNVFSLNSLKRTDSGLFLNFPQRLIGDDSFLLDWLFDKIF